MATYKYTARNLASKKTSGEMEAQSREELARKLRQDNLYLIDCKEAVSDSADEYKMKLNELSSFSRDIGTMLSSGLSLINIFSIMIKRETKEKLKHIYNDIYIQLQRGETLSSAMEMKGKAFPSLMIQMYRSGETSGQMAQVALTMAKQYEKDHRLNKKVQSAMIYPIVLVIVTILILIVIFVGVLPKFFDLFEGVDVPFITTLIMGMAKGFVSNWLYLLIGFLVLLILLSSLMQVSSVRLWVDRKKLKIKKFGKLLSIIYTARFARTLCSLYSSGIGIVTALMITRSTIGNKYLESQFDHVIRSVRNGTSLSNSISEIDGFDPKLTSSIYVGEESGRLGDILTSLADDFDYEAEVASTQLVAIMEPLMIIVLALIILVVVLAVILPIYSIYQNAGKL